MKISAALLFLILLSAAVRAQDAPLPAASDGGDFEPAQKLETPDGAAVPPTPAVSPQDRLLHCQAALAAAQKRAAEGEGLFKDGILSRVEMEGRSRMVVKAAKELADAMVAVESARADAARKSFATRKITQADLDAAIAALKSAQEAAATASAAWDKSQLDAASLDLQRKRKLYAEGVCSQRELQIAEDRLVLLSGTLPNQRQ